MREQIQNLDTVRTIVRYRIERAAKKKEKKRKEDNIKNIIYIFENVTMY